MIKERPILFSAPMVRALLDGSKTQTRRALRIQPPDWHLNVFAVGREHYFHEGSAAHPGKCWPAYAKGVSCPYGQPGDRLWVREAWRTVAEADTLPPRDLTPAHRIWYEADALSQPGAGRYRPPMFMPRWASRGLYEIISVRVERLQDISEADCIAEGCTAKHTTDADWSARQAYAVLWESINGGGSWTANPWVWAIEFKVIK